MELLLNLRSRDLGSIAETVDLMSRFARRTGETQDRSFAQHGAIVDLTWSQHLNHIEHGGYRIRRITPEPPKEG